MSIRLLKVWDLVDTFLGKYTPEPEVKYNKVIERKLDGIPF
jgi:hypothetical protein